MKNLMLGSAMALVLGTAASAQDLFRTEMDPIAIAASARATPVAGDISEVCFCVRCGKSLWVPAGDVRCRHCDATFFVELRDVKDLPGAILR